MKFDDFQLPPPIDLSGIRIPPSAEQTNKLIDNTSLLTAGMKRLADSSSRLEKLSEALIKETSNVHREVAILGASSTKLESLTVRLNTLTWILIFLTALALIPVGKDLWKAYHESQTAPVSAPM
jgi:hypothetical protein